MYENRVLTPPTYLREREDSLNFNALESAPSWEKIGRNFIYLFGPIQGAEDWQSDAIKILHGLDSELHLISPRRTNEGKSEYSHEKKMEQISWERAHLEKTWERGVSMFWLPKEFEKIERRDYAQTSRLELGESKVRHKINRSKLVIGIEPRFPGENYIRRIFSDDCPDVRIYDNLEETCEEAAKLTKF